MNLRSLHYFTEIVRLGSYGKAADSIPLSQPALSKAIRQLEDELGATLLERGRRGVGVKMTAAGEVLWQHARTMLDGQVQLLADLEALRGLRQGVLRLGLPPLGSAEVFAGPIAHFREQYPAVRLQLREQGSEELEQALRAGEIELTATLLPLRPDLDALPVRTEPMMLAVPRQHPLASRASVALTELDGVPLVQLENGFVLNRMVHDACIAAGFAPQEGARSAQPNFALALVAAGVGVMCLPRLVAQRHANEGIRLLPLDAPQLDWRLAMAWRRGVPLSPAARAWLALVERECVVPATPPAAS